LSRTRKICPECWEFKNVRVYMVATDNGKAECPRCGYREFKRLPWTPLTWAPELALTQKEGP